MSTPIKTHDLVVTRVFDAPVEQVWQAWSEPELVMRWWGPQGFTCPLARMDFRPGGTSLVCMRAPQEFGGQDMYNTWTYRKIVPLERIDYILRFTDEDGQSFDPAERNFLAGIPKEVLNVNTFRDLGDGRTELAVMEIGFMTEQASELSRTGLQQCLDKMAAIFSGS